MTEIKIAREKVLINIVVDYYGHDPHGWVIATLFP